jgi:hypothetical protein
MSNKIDGVAFWLRIDFSHAQIQSYAVGEDILSPERRTLYDVNTLDDNNITVVII